MNSWLHLPDYTQVIWGPCEKSMAKVKTFYYDTVAAISPLFALAAVPVLLGVGVAADYARLIQSRAELTAALDGAVLAAAQSTITTDLERIDVGKTYFAKNFTDVQFAGSEATISIANGRVTAKAQLDMQTSFMRLAGISTMDLSGEAEARLPAAGDAELVLVLDYSGSMNSHGKYDRMAEAAIDMIESLEDAADDVSFKVGLVPFSAMVRTSMSAAYVNQSSSGATWTGCTQDRAFPFNTTVATPGSDPNSKWGYIDGTGENNGSYGCNAYDNKNLTIRPLSTDLEEVKDQLEEMRPLGNTNIALGAEFGWNLLDPALPFAEAASYTDQNTRKYLVLLTDGVQTSKEWGNGNTRSIGNAQSNLLALCSGMRAKNITVFTIAYDITDPAVTNLLQSCAPGRYFEPAVNGNDLSAVFSEITAQITDEVVRLLR